MGATESTLTGDYEVIGDPAEADCVIGLSFGTLSSKESVNYLLAQQAASYAKPIIAQQEIADALSSLNHKPAHIISGDPSGYDGDGLTSWDVLMQAKKYMQANDFTRPLLIAQAHHIGRVTAQAELVFDSSYTLIVPNDLTSQFDPTSEQVWTRSLELWLVREIPAQQILRTQNRL